jgi:hypothetical protein
MAGGSFLRSDPADAADSADCEPSKVSTSDPRQDAIPRGAASEVAMRRLFETHYTSIWRLLRRLGVPLFSTA